MITRQRTHWFRMLFIWHGSVLKKIVVQLMIIAVFSLMILYFNGTIYDYKVHLNPTIFTLIGLALAIFMGFCNTAGYDRWWEGRKLWGSLVIESRSLTRQILTLVNDPSPDAKEHKAVCIRMIAAFAWALNYQLRGKTDMAHLSRLLTENQFNDIREKKYKPVAILDLMGAWINEQHQRHRIDAFTLTTIDRQLNLLSQVAGGCERISNTPLPFAYSVLLHRTVYFYCFWLPFGLVDSLGWMMPLIVLLISYTFIALDAIVQEIAEPFGEEENDLPLNSICKTIEYSVFEQADLPREAPAAGNTYFID